MTAIRKHHRLDGLKTRNVFSQNSGSMKLEDQSVNMVGLFWGLSSWLVDGHLLSVSDRVFTLYMFMFKFPLLIWIIVVLDYGYLQWSHLSLIKCLKYFYKHSLRESSLAIRWLGLGAFTAVASGSILGGRGS